MLTWRNTHSWEDPAWPGKAPCQNCKRTTYRQKSQLLGQRWKARLAPFWGKKLQAHRLLKMWLSYISLSLLSTFLVSSLWRCWQVFIFFLHANTSDMQATDPIVVFNVKYYVCTLCLCLQSFNDDHSLGETIFPRWAPWEYFGRNQCSAKAH